MCFSTEASFVSGSILAIAGIISLLLVKEKQHYFFAAIPFIFSIQQISEGFLWLSHDSYHYLEWRDPAKYVFLTFAQVVWPFWIPFSVILIEKNKVRKKWIKITLYLGIMLATYHTFCLFTFPSDAFVLDHHFHYTLEHPLYNFYLSGLWYFIPTVVSLLLSSILNVKILGVFIFLSFIATWIFYNDYIISVWCFFAALISIMIVYIIFKLNKSG